MGRPLKLVRARRMGNEGGGGDVGSRVGFSSMNCITYVMLSLVHIG